MCGYVFSDILNNSLMRSPRDIITMWLLLWEAKRIIRKHKAIGRNILIMNNRDNEMLLILRNAKYKLRDEGYNED
jgi:hypothetical protein